MNPRIQVEHTVTEEVTDVDLVQSQMRIASGETLADLGLSQDTVRLRGAALQCRITTEDPANNFRPDTGVITTYRSPGGAGVRVDGGTSTPAPRSPRTSTRCWPSSPVAAAPSRRPSRRPGARSPSSASAASPPTSPSSRRCSTTPTSPPATSPPRSSRPTRSCSPARGTGRPRQQAAHLPRRRHRQPAARRRRRSASTRSPSCPTSTSTCPAPDGSRQLLLEVGPEEFARRLRAQQTGSRSPTPPSATPTSRCSRPGSAPATCSRSPATSPAPRPSCGRSRPGAARRTTWRCASCPRTRGSGWPSLRQAVPNICLQMLLRGRNTVGYTPYPTEVTDAFVEEAAATGIDVFRIFDALNDVEQMRPAIEAVRATGTAVAEVALCYTGDLSDPDERLYTLDYYLAPGRADRRRRRARAGDQGHGRAAAGAGRAHPGDRAARALRPAGAPAHPRHRRAASSATLLAAIDAGVDAVDAATASMAGTTSQPPLSALVSATDHGRARDRAVAGRGLRARALLGGDPPGLRAVRVRAAVADRARLPPRDPRRPALQPAPAGDRARPRREVRADRGHVRRGERHPRQHRQGDPVLEGGRRPRAAPGRRSAPTRPSSPRTPASSTSPTR